MLRVFLLKHDIKKSKIVVWCIVSIVCKEGVRVSPIISALLFIFLTYEPKLYRTVRDVTTYGSY